MGKREILESFLGRGRPILADGAMGTMLHAQGVSLQACFDELNLARPQRVLEIHQAYLEAGAELIETNTFGANRYRLAAVGLERQVGEINAAGVKIARQAVEASPHPALIAGSVGPLGVRLAPFGRLKPEQARQAFREQIEALVDAGVDLILLETHTDLREVQEAILASRSVGDLPIVASMTFTRDDRTLLGDRPELVAERLASCDVDFVGANCSGGPAQLLRVIRLMRAAVPNIQLSVMPNAGWPEQVGGRILYHASTDYFAEHARAFRDAGAQIIGGCCGTTPAHIAAMRAALEETREPQLNLQTTSPANGRIEAVPAVEQPTRLSARLAEGSFVVAVEIDPPRGFSTHKLLAAAHTLAEAGADVVNVADSPMARMRMSPWAACQLIQQEVQIETVLHFPTRGRNLIRIQGDLLAAHALGVRNVLVVMGDPTSIGDYPQAMDDYDVVPSGLIKLIKHGLNIGFDEAGADIGGSTSFYVGCALSLAAHDAQREARVLRRKLEAGADFILTQPVYSPDLVTSFLRSYADLYEPVDVPILVGILPLYSHRHAVFLNNEVPGISIPDPVLARVSGAGDHAPQEGVHIAVETIQALKGIVQGAYLMPPLGRYDLAAELIEAVREKNPTADHGRRATDAGR
ncbi:MAG TPA: bifunctional homocysteine S-methyltransferase/methylenetetrahydrofolate reductase [Anaerolineales bacterium]|nr:bifunctional homocysteine S-methyltransferase/methylenetetrahydrofolate reductase [Anaerolineales bacterium]